MSFVRVVPIFVLFVTCLSGCQSKTLRGWDYGINPDAPPIYINRDSGFWDPEGEGVRDAFGEVPQDLPAACEGDGCPDTICSPGVRTCDLNTAVICLQDGRSFHEVPCNELICIEGQCLACLPGEKECSAENQARRCQADGLGWDETTDCGDKKCVSGECVFCIPGMRTCVGSEVHQCNAGSTDYEPVEDCDTENTGRMCHLGMCIDLCAYNDKFATNLGCEYWAIDMDQSEENDGQNSPFAIVVSNTNEFFTATVKVEKWDGEETTIKAPPKTATVISLEPYNIVGVRQEKLARRVTSNLPIVAYQFNPLENVGVFSNDASLLLPTNALGTKYIVMSWPHRPGLGTLASNFAVVGTSLTPTTVTIRVSAKTAAGGTVPALNAGDTWTTTLAQYEVLNIETLDSFTDLTGSSVEAIDGRVALFGGHVCANAPMSTCKMGMCSYDVMGCSSDSDCPVFGACDHLEEQIQPHAAWGKDYVIGRTFPRGKAPDLVRVLAGESGTIVTVMPPVATVPILQKGEYFDFEIQDTVRVVGTNPILIGHFLEGQDAPGSAHESCQEALFRKTCGGGPFGSDCSSDEDCSPGDANIGDPSFIIGVPIEQFRTEYVFLVPTKYALNYVNVIGPPDAVVTLDGGPLPSPLTATPVGGWSLARFELPAGSHSLSSDKKVGIVVYGWDQYVSYGYPGGMNVESLSVVP
jgi:hypothetical protein